ncbi:hypothetical protein WJX72_007063 [[Myrmecia] bisecta]|uniref:50S ribosomal protein L32, chloroplastic n=1 Tax=[Myrmecia] bisecta TaxID=41462 RepID=A0AAW1Q222_9CHLO
MAAPKRKTTPHRKGLRNMHNKLKWTPVVAQCSVCQRIMAPHQVPTFKIMDGRMNPINGVCKHSECPSARYARSSLEAATATTDAAGS